jgi:hypothetical protein
MVVRATSPNVPICGRPDLVLRLLFQPRDDLLRFLERPGVRLFGKAAQVPRRAQGVGHDFLRMRLL